MLSDVLDQLEDLGIRVRLCISDMAFTNQGVFRRFGISEHMPFLLRYGRKIYFIYDICHLVKLIRTHMQRKKGFRFDGGLGLWHRVKKAYALIRAQKTGK